MLLILICADGTKLECLGAIEIRKIARHPVFSRQTIQAKQWTVRQPTFLVGLAPCNSNRTSRALPWIAAIRVWFDGNEISP
jgi:hypothetical protein